MQDIDRKLGIVAATQHSLIALDDVVRAGGNKDHARRRVNSGRWESVADGVYRLTGVPWTYEAQVLALIFAAGDGAVASFFCALRLLGLGFRSAPPEISIPRDHFHRPDGARVHTSRDLGRCDILTLNGIPITDPARTILDVAQRLRPATLRRLIEQGRRAELLTWHDLIVCVATHARRGRRGIRKLRAVIAAGVADDEITDTDSELASLGLLREYELGEFTVHHRVYDDEGQLLAEMDFAFVDDMVDIEINGSVHLVDPKVQEKDEARDHDMRGRGWTVRRIWWEIPVREPERFIRIVRATLTEARSRRGHR